MKVFQIGADGIRRYSKEVHENTVNNKEGIKIDYMKVEAQPVIGSALNLPIVTAFKDFGGYDIVHNFSSYPFFPVNLGGAIKVMTAHEMQPVLYPELTGARLHSIKDVLWELAVVRLGLDCMLSCDYVIANSKQSMEGVIKAGFPRNKVFATPLGIDKRFLRPLRQKKDKKAFKAGLVGTLGPQKNIFFAIDSFKMLKDKDIEFELWGKNIYTKKEILDYIGSEKRITFKGQVPEDKIVDIYDSFDVFIFPSIFEGFGIPIIEAKARGLPVIVWKGGHLSEEVEEYCIKARDEEHMADIVEDLKQNGYDEKLRKKAMESARQYTWERTGRETIEAYKKMV
jgi:glycosyltransferase involved in cell wall biosynthesis